MIGLLIKIKYLIEKEKENLKMQNPRTCIISREKLQKEQLFQIKFSPKGEFILGKSQEKNIGGKSIYLKNDKKIFEQFVKRPKRFLENFLKRKILDEKFLELKDNIKKNLEKN
ncbi:DUF448 domain-containing protein [Candidatus Gracilibacteria bacterium]|nr:DUF448 domain-containing protein [Candidatus Gracilibacteria bacterium]